MLGLSSIQHTAHRLEDCFKVLKEHPIKVDQKLESLFLGVSDTLKELIENLQEPFGPTEEIVETLMSETEPVFKWLHQHLELLVQQSSQEVIKNTSIWPKTSSVTSPQPIPQKSESWQNLQTLQSQVIRTLREMLQLFKQTATPQTRQRLCECCDQLAELGEEFNWSNWYSLCRTAGNAIANPENTYLTLAKIVITDIKQALELVSAGREAEMTISQQLQALVNVEAAIELLEIPLESADDLDTPASSSTFYLVTDKELPKTTSDTASTELLDIEPQDRITSLSELFEQLNSNDASLTHSSTDTNNLEVGIAQLNTLADSFEGESSDSCRTWDKEELLDMSAEEKLERILSNSNTEKTDSHSETVINEETISDKHKVVTTTEDFTLQLSDDFLEKNIDLSSDKTVKPEDTTEIIQSNSKQSISASEKIQDQVSSLLELVLDDKQPLPTDEINQIQTEIIPNIELSKNQDTSFDDFFLETAKAESMKEIDSGHDRESKTIPHQDKISTLEELFTEVDEANSIALPGNNSTSANVFTLLPETEDLNNLWKSEAKEEKGEFSPVHQQNAASELEEILLANAGDNIFDDVDQPLNFTLESLILEDADFNFQLEEQQFNLLFSPDDNEEFYQK
ncbi:MAG: hypothetical protein HC773_17405 [Scytonema sp. CRU_2_7]|nr:hypothetical protein [Scytonema sp. CRU_2_7]